jgi:hypothetical protein
MSPICPNVIWAMDFQFDTTADGRTLKMLNVIDEFTREALAIEVDRAIDADGVVAVLDRLALQLRAPAYVRFDNGPEFVAHAVNDWCRFNNAASLFIATPAQTPHPAAPSCETLIVQLTITSLLDSPIDKAHIALTVAPGDAEGAAPVGYHGETPALPEPPLGQGRQHLVIRSITGEPRRARLHPAQLK